MQAHTMYLLTLYMQCDENTVAPIANAPEPIKGVTTRTGIVAQTEVPPMKPILDKLLCSSFSLVLCSLPRVAAVAEVARPRLRLLQGPSRQVELTLGRYLRVSPQSMSARQAEVEVGVTVPVATAWAAAAVAAAVPL